MTTTQQTIIDEQTATTIRVLPLGGTVWLVLRDREQIGRVEYGTLDSDGQYVGDDELLEALVRERYDIPVSVEIQISASGI